MFEGLTGEVEKLAYRFHDGTPLSALSYLGRVFITDRNYCYFSIVFNFTSVAIIVVRSFDMRWVLTFYSTGLSRLCNYAARQTSRDENK